MSENTNATAGQTNRERDTSADWWIPEAAVEAAVREAAA